MSSIDMDARDRRECASEPSVWDLQDAAVTVDALTWNADRLRTATHAAGVALWSWNVVTDEIELDERAHVLWNIPRGEAVTFKGLSEHIHPEDLGVVESAFAATRHVDGAYEIDFRIDRAGDTRWISARGQGRDKGIVDQVMFAIFMDVTERKQAEEAREMLASEMSHRIKNLLTITSALTAIAERSTSTKSEMARDLTRRIMALGTAHDLVRPIAGASNRQGAFMADLLEVLLAPYDDQERAGGRISISAIPARVGETGATALALITHELATNSMKYGSLSKADGKVAISCSLTGDDVTVIWRERDGPPVRGSPDKAGFGSTLIARSLSGQLGGAIAFDWLAEGLAATIRMSKARLEA